MEKKVFGFPRVAIVLLAASLFLSCGFEPAWKSSDTTVSFRLGPAARAIAPGDGYLYIRPLGGPLGTGPKPYIGPIKLSSGDVYTTTEIEPGSYDGFMIIYAADRIDERDIYIPSLENEFFISEALSFADIHIFDIESRLGNAVDFAVSCSISDPFVVRDGVMNEVHSLLKPATAFLADFSSDFSHDFYFEQLAVHRVYIKIRYLEICEDAENPGVVNVWLNATENVAVQRVLFFGEDGSPRSIAYTPGALTAGEHIMVTMPWNTIDASLYCYIEFLGYGLRVQVPWEL